MKKSALLEHHLAPHLALVGVQLMFGSAPVVGKIALQSFPSSGIVGFRVFGAAIAFFLLQCLTGKPQLADKNDYWRLALLSLIGVVFNQLFFFLGLSLTTATNTSLLAVTIPIFTVLFSAVFGFDKLNWRKILGIISAACGVAYLIDPARAAFSPATVGGDFVIILNCLFYAAYVAVSKTVVERNGALKSLAWLFLFGSVICLPVGAFALSEVDFSAVSAAAWATLAFLILVPTIGAYYLNAWALARVAPSTVAVYIYLQPLIGFTLAVLFLGESLSVRALVAGLLIFAGVFLVTRRQNREKNEELAHDTLH